MCDLLLSGIFIVSIVILMSLLGWILNPIGRLFFSDEWEDNPIVHYLGGRP